MDAINNRYEEIRHLEKVHKMKENKRVMKMLHEERIKSFKMGQRILLQNYCIEKEAIFKNEFNQILKEEPQKQELSDEKFQEIL